MKLKNLIDVLREEQERSPKKMPGIVKVVQTKKPTPTKGVVSVKFVSKDE